MFDEFKQSDFDLVLVSFKPDFKFDKNKLKFPNKKTNYKKGELLFKYDNKEYKILDDVEVLKFYDDKNCFENSNIVFYRKLTKGGVFNIFENDFNQLLEKTSKISELKQKIFELSIQFYSKKLIEYVYTKFKETYDFYFNSFQNIFSELDVLKQQFNDKKTQIEQIEAKILELDPNNTFPSTFNSLIEQRNNLLKELETITTKLNSNLGKLQNLRKDIPQFQTEDSNNIKEAKINFVELQKGTDISTIQKTLKNQQTTFQSLVLDEKAVSVETPKSLFNRFKNLFNVYTNNIGIKVENSIFLFEELLEDFEPFDYSFQFDVKEFPKNLSSPNHYTFQLSTGKYILWSGKFQKNYEQFVRFVLESDKSNPKIVETLNQKENNFYENFNSFIQEFQSLSEPISKDWAFIVLNKEEAFIKFKSNKTGFLDIIINTFQIEFETIKNELEQSKKELKEIFDFIDQVQNKFNQIEDSEKVFMEKEVFCGFNKTKIKNVLFPNEENKNSSNSLTEEDVKFRGFPIKDPSVSPGFVHNKWWDKFLNLASVVGLNPIYYPIGFLIPNPSGITKVPFPVFYKHFLVIPTPTSLIQIGMAICGSSVSPMVTEFNMMNLTARFLVGVRPGNIIKKGFGTKIIDVPKVKDAFGNEIELNSQNSLTSPFEKDDLPNWERLSLNNSLFVLFLNDWCKASKKTFGFFEN